MKAILTYGLMSMPEPNDIKQSSFISDVEKHSTKFLIGILLLGLSLRLIFTYALADDFHYHSSIYEFSDTQSFTEGFINFWERGKYTHNGNDTEAAFGRLPG